MAKIGRNEPCPCGSGRKVKRCCSVARGPSEQSLAQAFLATAAREAVGAVEPVSSAELEVLVEELVELPRIDLSLHAELPKLVSPALARLCEAIADDEDTIGTAALDEVLAEIDTPGERARLARGVLAARDAGKIDAHLAAVALVDLAGGSRALLCSSLVEAVAVRAGAARTPAGLLLAA